MKAIIIAAGQGTRLLPLTLQTPKCLVRVDGRAILDHQLDAVGAAGVAEAVVVGGYRIEQIADHLARRDAAVATTLVFNPFWSIASSIGSVWAARDHLAGEFLLMNGDTVFAPSIVDAAVRAAAPGLTLVVDRVSEADDDDMRVEIGAGGEPGQDVVLAVGKGLDPARATYRSLGLVRSRGGDAYARALRDVIGRVGGTNAYHHAILAHLVPHVNALVVDGADRWQEVDAPADIVRWETGRGALPADR